MCGHDTKKLYNLVNNMTGRTKSNPMPPGRKDTELADEFADFFLDKIRRIRDDLADCRTYTPIEIEVEPLENFNPLSVGEVVSIIRSMPTKSCESDVLPTSLLKRSLDRLGKTITAIVNISLQEGIFADKWKVAIVRPLLKKAGLDLVAANYRPVSNLPFLSKVIEKCMLKHFNRHCEMNNLLPELQSAYRQHYSCETALVKMADDILWSMEHQRITAVVAIDLSAAFDTVDHDILLKVLDTRFGIRGTANKWVESYLRPRSVKVNCGSAYSITHPIEFSVPQGSGAGPGFYSAYASTMKDIVPTTIAIHGYVDDHALKKSFRGGSKPEEVATIKLLEEATSTIKVWMDENRLKMNNAKTEFIFYGSRQQLSKLTTTTIDINGVNIESGKSIRYLRADLDNRLSLKIMINRKCRTAMCNLQKIKLIRRSLTLSAATKIALGLVISHLDYANALYSGLPDIDIKKLQRIQDIAAKIVTQSGKYDSSTAARKALHWLPIQQRIDFKVCTLVFRSLHGMAPGYLADLLKPEQSRKPGLRSQNTTGVLHVPFTRRKTFADRSFSVFGPKTWNSLPNTLRTNMDYGKFRSGLKAIYLLRRTRSNNIYLRKRPMITFILFIWRYINLQIVLYCIV